MSVLKLLDNTSYLMILDYEIGKKKDPYHRTQPWEDTLHSCLAHVDQIILLASIIVIY